jgi:phage-related holin
MPTVNGLSKVVFNMIRKIYMNNLSTKVVVLSAAFFAPIMTAMIAVGVLVTIDTITGVIGAKRIGEKIESKKFGRVVTKSLVYQLLIISSHIIECYLFDMIPIVKITLGFLAMTEFLSIGENFYKCTGKNFVSYIKEYLDVKFRGMLKVDKDDNDRQA